MALAKAQAYQIDVNAGLINSDVLREARINQLDADEIYPGLQDAIDQFGSEPEEPETPPWTPQSGAPGFPSASSGVPAKPAIPGAPAQKALPAPAKGPQSAIPPKPGVQLAKPVADRLLNEMAFLRDEIARKAASDQEKQQRASQLKGIASRLTAGEEPTHSDLATLGLKEKAGLKWFMPAAAELFGISSRAVRPHIAPLIHTGYSDMGAKYESVHSASGLKAIAAGLKSRAADALLDATPRTLYVRRDVLNGDVIAKWAKAQASRRRFLPTICMGDDLLFADAGRLDEGRRGYVVGAE